MIPRSPHPIVASAGIALFLAPALSAQTPPPAPASSGFVEEIAVELVNVDVWVTDENGDPVTGLSAEDFGVLHDGEPVPITNFSEVRPEGILQPIPGADGGGDAEEAAENAARRTAPAPPAHVVLYFDRMRMHPSSYRPVLRGVDELLETSGIRAERIMVLRQERSLTVEAPFGSTEGEIREALERLTDAPPLGADLEAETREALDAVRTAWEQSQDTAGRAGDLLASIPTAPGTTEPGAGPGGAGGSPRAVVGGVGSGAGPDACGMFVNQIQPILDSFSRVRSQRIAISLANLSEITSFLAGLPGIKTLVYLSDGLDVQPGTPLATYASRLCPAGSTELLSDAVGEEMSRRFQQLTRHANTNLVTMYALQASGLEAPGLGDSSGRGRRGGGNPGAFTAFESAHRSSQRQGLGLLADETGGRVVTDKNEFGPALGQIGREIQHYYSIAYAPPAGDTDGDGRAHRIEVRLGEKGLNARYRQGYVEKSRTRWLDERLDGAMNLGIVSNPLEVRLGAGSMTPTESGAYRLPLHIMVPTERLVFVPGSESTTAEVLVRAQIRNLDDGSVLVTEKTFAPSRAEDSDVATLPIELDLPPGTLLMAIAVQDARSREASFVSTSLQVGPGSG